MSTRNAIAALGIALLIAISLAASGLEALKVKALSDEVTVLRAQMASHADMVQTSQSYAALNHRLDNVEFNMGGLNGAVNLLKQRKDEVTTDDMQEFSANLSAILTDIDARLKPLELDYTRRSMHY